MLVPLLAFYISSFLALLAGNAISNFGLIILTQERTGSNGLSGVVFFLNYAIPSLTILLAGVLIDQFSRRGIVFLSYTIYFASALLLALSIERVDSGIFLMPLIILSAVLNGFALSMAQPGRFALLGTLVSNSSIKKATAVLNLTIIFGFTTSPLLVSFLLKKGNWSTVFTIIALLFALSGALLILVNSSNSECDSMIEKKDQSVKHTILEGINFIRSNSFIFNLIMLAIPPLIILGTVQVLAPAIGREILGLSEWGQGKLIAYFGLGLTIGSIGAISLLNWRYASSFIIVSFPILSCCFLIITLALEYGATFLAFVLVCSGLIVGIHGSLIPSLIQASTPDRLRGRIMSFYKLNFTCMPAIAAVLAGYLSDHLGLSTTVIIIGCGTLFIGLIPLFKFRKKCTFNDIS